MTIKNDFQKLPIKDFAKKIICDGNLYLSSGDRKFYLMKPGVFVDPGFIKKYAVTNPIFDYQSVVNEELKEKFKIHFRDLRYLQYEKDLRMKCLEIMKEFHAGYSKDEHFLSFALACYETFCNVPLEDQAKMHETDMHLFRKALYSGAFAIVSGIANDFYNYLMLKDFYIITFSLDIGLCESSYSYFVAEACNAENRVPGSGKQYLKTESATKFETDVFLKHPRKSYEFLKQSSLLSHPELAEISLYQHELNDGTGFPRGVIKGQVSSWEAVVIFADALVEISSSYEFEESVVSYLVNFENKKLNDLPVGRVYKKLCLAFNHFESLKETGS